MSKLNNTSEHQFVRFGDLPAQEDCEEFVPVDDNYATGFYTKEEDYPSTDYTQRVDLVEPDGTIIQEGITNLTRPYPFGDNTASTIIAYHQLKKVRPYLAPGDCFRLRLMEIANQQIGSRPNGDLSFSAADLINHTYRKDLSVYKETENGSGWYMENVLLQRGRWTITIKNASLMARYGSTATMGRLRCPLKVAVFKEESATYNPDSNNILVEKTAEIGTTTIVLEFEIREATYIQVGFTSASDLDYYQSIYPCGGIRYDSITATGEEIRGYSNILQVVENQGEYSHLKYSCGEEGTFDFPWARYAPGAPAIPCQVLVPLLVNKPQYSQSDKTYEKSNGEKVTLYANITKEYKGETDYISEEAHRKITIAICCDSVQINGESLAKSDKYEIDWDNQAETDCGTKLVRATFKMKANTASRNANC